MKKTLLILSLILFIPNMSFADSHKIIDADIQEYLEDLGNRDMEKVESYKVLKNIDDKTNYNNKNKIIIEKTNNSEHIIHKNKENSNNPKTGILSMIPLLGILTLNLIAYKKTKETN